MWQNTLLPGRDFYLLHLSCRIPRKVCTSYGIPHVHISNCLTTFTIISMASTNAGMLCEFRSFTILKQGTKFETGTGTQCTLRWTAPLLLKKILRWTHFSKFLESCMEWTPSTSKRQIQLGLRRMRSPSTARASSWLVRGKQNNKAWIGKNTAYYLQAKEKWFLPCGLKHLSSLWPETRQVDLPGNKMEMKWN